MFPTVGKRTYRLTPLVVPLDSCLTAAACLSIVNAGACSFAVSQASDLALLVGYVAEEDFNFIPYIIVSEQLVIVLLNSQSISGVI